MTGSNYTSRIHHVARERLDESLRRRSDGGWMQAVYRLFPLDSDQITDPGQHVRRSGDKTWMGTRPNGCAVGSSWEFSSARADG
jgi:hypothetical protein